ncbi:4295_t:CDS:2 [Racocetra fulgida]|uniref:4295_t:CDS:1 n=1 Tax=Racocetra fulgida TaxID=60492 RepID=A0A9N8VTW8_9GLOM|nr:4295_t:CDS:2 [Racocetra fulgida]
MSTSNILTHDPNDKTYDPNDETCDPDDKTPWCSSCRKFKSVIEFMRPSGRRIKKFATCNDCAEKDRIYISPDGRTSADTSDSKSSKDDLIYNLSDLKELIAIKFREGEELDANFEFTVMVDIEKETVDKDTLSLESGQDMETKKFHTIAKMLLIPLQKGSNTIRRFEIYILI